MLGNFSQILSEIFVHKSTGRNLNCCIYILNWNAELEQILVQILNHIQSSVYHIGAGLFLADRTIGRAFGTVCRL